MLWSLRITIAAVASYVRGDLVCSRARSRCSHH